MSCLATPFRFQWDPTGETVAGDAGGASGTTPNRLLYPISIALDSSNALYIGEYMNNRTQKWIVGATSGITAAGQANGASGLSTSTLSILCDVVLDSNNNIYISEQYNHRVLRWNNNAVSGTVLAGVSGIFPNIVFLVKEKIHLS